LERDLMLQITRFSDMMHLAYEEMAPHRICQYIYDLADKFSSFYHETKIISDENSEERQSSLISMISLIQELLKTCINLLGFEAPERM
jgi:arginyl-tRNA synthetase